MKTKALQTFIGLSMVYFLALISAFLPTATFADDDSQNLILLGNVILQPGDVINFKGGGGAFLSTGEYGHTGMYLGKDTTATGEKGEKIFLDFTTNKNGPFRGRISNEEKFLTDNISHVEFDVYRLNGRYALNQKKLVESAKDISTNKNFGALIDCANAASRALSVAANIPIIKVSPDGFANDLRFAPATLTVDIKAALDELREAPLQISGEWLGTYSYDDRERIGEEVGFTLTVNQQGSEITGRVRDSEVGSANIVGTFNAETMQIYFTKTYGDDNPQVAYNGTVSGNTAAGRWHIGDYAGSWEMHR